MPTLPLNQYVIGLGSNLGERRGLLDQAMAKIEREIGMITARAGVHETAPVGAADQPFLNSAVLVNSPWEPVELMRRLLKIEEGLGRVRTVKWGNRTIDLDVLLWAKSGVSSRHEDQMVTIPHPHLLERAFALVPAAEIAGDWTHPATGKTIAVECAERGFSLR